ncbi:hypothetical protein H4R20_000792 [Coemansia guatemalensis]|uniref:Uncharacterized protein n=1 Tax=Coemansia guatemalensis TaxID=2761395 RepID=A0A9W8HYK2_9FUNG|nr:hypothetical protein H4R20_000792 [Coemansia guatemalensis]
MEDTADAWQDTRSWSDTYSWDKQSDGDDDYDVRTAEVICGKVNDPITTTAMDLPPADDSLVGPWRIPVTAETNGELLAMWAELDTGALHTLVSANITEELHADMTPAEGEIHLAVEGSSIWHVGTFPLVLCMMRHHIAIATEVLPGNCRSPILIGHDILSRYPISDLLGVLHN